MGVLTREMADSVEYYDAIEIDRDLVRRLEPVYGGKKGFRLYCADALTFDLHSLLGKTSGQLLRIVGNLPYNITTPLLFHVVQFAPIIQDMHFMVQREVADRLVAPPGSKTYGRLSVMMQYRARIEKLFDVAPSSFMPPPQVYSSFIRIMPFKKLPITANDEDVFTAIVQAAFNQRRKTIHNSLKTFITDEQWQRLSIDPQTRPEQLSVEQFVAISNIMTNKLQQAND
jgi:16S rRNA (adenine1518-N6/adenine1519-N6)-dimethyltransferase